MIPTRRTLAKFRNNPASIRYATVAIISVTVAVVVLGAVLVWAFDRKEFPTFGTAIWFTLQTVTTVGYGDTVPEDPLGRVVAGVVMVTAIGLITVVTAAITSAFVQAARAKNRNADQAETTDSLARLEASLETIATRLGQLETTLAEKNSDPEDADG